MKRALFLLALLAAGAAGGPALAHAQLVRADPRVGAALAAPPARLWLKFTEVPRLNASGVMLTGPDGVSTLLAPLSRDPADPRTMVAPAPAGMTAGSYRVTWRVLSPDGHRTQGDFRFTVAPRAAPGR